MKRRHAYSLVFLLLFAAGAAHAASYAERIEQQLRALGYAEVTVSRTLLGRTRIFASGKAGTREIVIDPRNGEILRDIIIGPGNVILIGQMQIDDDDGDDKGGNSNSGSSGDGDDDGEDGSGEDDDGEDDDGEDDDGEDGDSEDGDSEDGDSEDDDGEDDEDR